MKTAITRGEFVHYLKQGAQAPRGHLCQRSCSRWGGRRLITSVYLLDARLFKFYFRSIGTKGVARSLYIAGSGLRRFDIFIQSSPQYPSQCVWCVCVCVRQSNSHMLPPRCPMALWSPQILEKRSEFRIGQFTLLYLRSFMVPKTGPQIWQAVAFGRSDGPALVGRKWTLF